MEQPTAYEDAATTEPPIAYEDAATTESRVAQPADTGTFDVAKQSLARPALIMAVGTTLSRVTGLGRVMAIAFALGVSESRLADSFNIASTLPFTLYELLLGGVLASVFIPVIVEELRTKDRDEAWTAISALVTTALTGLCILAGLVALVAPLIIEIYSSRVEGAESAAFQDVATELLRLFAPQIALFGFAAVAAALLNAHGKFAVPMFAPIVNNVIQIGVFLGFALLVSGIPTNGEVADDPTLALVLGLGPTLGVAVMAAINWPFVRRLPGKLRFRPNLRHPAVVKVARLSGWTVLYVSVNALGFFVSTGLATGQQGGPSAYLTGYTFFGVPIGIAAVSILAALTPQLAAHYVDGRPDRFRARLASGFRATALVLLPSTAAILVLAEPMIDLALGHGVVGSESVDLVAAVLRWFALGLLAFAAYQLVTRGFYARQDAKTPSLVNIWQNALTIGLDFALFPPMGVEGLALAHGLGYVGGTAVGAWVLRRRIGGLDLRPTAIDLLKVTFASVVCGGAMLAVVLLVAAVIPSGDPRFVVQIVLAGAIGAAVYLVLARLLRVAELDTLLRLVPARLLPGALRPGGA